MSIMILGLQLCKISEIIQILVIFANYRYVIMLKQKQGDHLLNASHKYL